MSNADVRARVLREFYDQEMRGEHRGIESGDFARQHGIPQRQVEVALKYLVDMGLLRGFYVLGTDVPVIMRITALGLDVVDNPRRFPEIEINPQIIQISGSVYGPIGQARDQSQVVQTIGGFSELEQLIDRRDELEQEEKMKLRGLLQELERELQQDSFSRSKVGKLLEVFRTYDWLFPLVKQMVTKAITGS